MTLKRPAKGVPRNSLQGRKRASIRSEGLNPKAEPKTRVLANSVNTIPKPGLENARRLESIPDAFKEIKTRGVGAAIRGLGKILTGPASVVIATLTPSQLADGTIQPGVIKKAEEEDRLKKK
tara:strand:+ start:448 stop:813 length:366 start_codon:yes stop_codon:yes gene_type:complete